MNDYQDNSFDDSKARDYAQKCQNECIEQMLSSIEELLYKTSSIGSLEFVNVSEENFEELDDMYYTFFEEITRLSKMVNVKTEQKI